MEPDTNPLTSEKLKRSDSISSKSRTVHWAPGEVRSSSKQSQQRDEDTAGDTSGQPNSAISKHQYFGPDVLILLGLTLFLAGLALTMYGLHTTFALLEIEISVMGIGPSLIAIGIVFMLLRILYCKAPLALIQRIKHSGTINTIHPIDGDKSKHAQERGAVFNAQQQKSVLVDPPPYSSSPNAVQSETVVKMETVDVATTKDSSGAKAVANLNDESSTTSQDYVMDELGCFSPSLGSKDSIRNKVISFRNNRNDDETVLLVQKLNGRKNSIEYHRDFNQTVNELGLIV